MYLHIQTRIYFIVVDHHPLKALIIPSMNVCKLFYFWAITNERELSFDQLLCTVRLCNMYSILSSTMAKCLIL